MNNKSEKLTVEQKAAIKAAENEAHFSAQSLLEEITPLIKSYFICEVKTEADKIEVSFPNGQKFDVYAKEN